MRAGVHMVHGYHWFADAGEKREHPEAGSGKRARMTSRTRWAVGNDRTWSWGSWIRVYILSQTH